MKAKILVILSLFTAPVLYAADPKTEAHPQLIAERYVERLESITFHPHSRNRIAFTYSQKGGCFVTETHIKQGTLIEVKTEEYALQHIGVSYRSVGRAKQLTLAGTEQSTPNILILPPDWNCDKDCGDSRKLHNVTTSFEFDNPIKSFVFSQDGNSLFVTLESGDTFSINTQERYSPFHHSSMPCHGRVLKCGNLNNCLLSYPRYPDCFSYLTTCFGKVVYDNPRHFSDSRRYPDFNRPHCLSDLSGNTLTVVPCTGPLGLTLCRLDEHAVAEEKTTPLEKEPCCLALDNNGDLMILAYIDGTIEIRDTADLELYGSFNIGSLSPSRYTLSTISKLVLSPLIPGWQNKITHEQIQDLTGPIYLAVGFRKKGERWDTVQIWDVESLIVDGFLHKTPKKKHKKKRKRRPSGRLMKSGLSQSHANEKEKESWKSKHF